MLPLTVFLFLSFQLLFVAYLDMKTRKISNQWFFINTFFYVSLVFIFPNDYKFNLLTFFYPTIFILVGFVLFLLNIMGGGDSKYIASMYLLVPTQLHESVFTYLLYTTIIVGSSLLLFNFLKNLDSIINYAKSYNILGIKKLFGKKFTYAPVIFIAWMWFGWQNQKIIQ